METHTDYQGQSFLTLSPERPWVAPMSHSTPFKMKFVDGVAVLSI